jgi:hypothetical protein
MNFKKVFSCLYRHIIIIAKGCGLDVILGHIYIYKNFPGPLASL